MPKKLIVLGAVAILGALLWWRATPFQGTAIAVPGPGARYFSNVTLRTHEGREVRFYDDLIRGKIVVLNFMYTHCDGV